MRKAAELFFGEKVTQANPRLYQKPLAIQTKRVTTITFREHLLREGRDIREITINCASTLEEEGLIDETMADKLAVVARRWDRDIRKTLKAIERYHDNFSERTSWRGALLRRSAPI